VLIIQAAPAKPGDDTYNGQPADHFAGGLIQL
jgi:hypothetical protein